MNVFGGSVRTEREVNSSLLRMEELRQTEELEKKFLIRDMEEGKELQKGKCWKADAFM